MTVDLGMRDGRHGGSLGGAAHLVLGEIEKSQRWEQVDETAEHENGGSRERELGRW